MENRFTKNIGDRITVLASECLGTPACEATIVGKDNESYLVQCDDEDPGDQGVVDHDGCVLDFSGGKPCRME